jgi:hypothetical protein
MYLNSKASFKSFRRFQDSLRKEFPGLVNKDEKKIETKDVKEVKKDDKGRIQEVYERRVKYY